MPDPDPKLAFLTTFLAERDVPCPLCSYNLRALTTCACPECGSEIEITVGLTEPRMAAFIAGVAGLAAGVGFNALMLLWLAWMLIFQRRGGPRLIEILPLPLGLAATSIGLLLWLKHRRSIRAMDPHKKRWLVASCYGLSIGMACLFFAVVR